MRTFLAFTPPPDVITAIESWRRLNWPLLERHTPPTNYHVTLVFTGDLKNLQVQKLHDHLNNVSSAAFDITLLKLGFWQKAGIFWVGTETVPSALSTLIQSLKVACHHADISIEKREYVPHLTLARRCTELPSAPLIEPSFSFFVDHFSLFESVKVKGKIIYQPVFDIQLETSA